MAYSTDKNDRFLTPREVRERTSLSRSQIDRMVKAGAFPKPYPLTKQRVGFLESEIAEWVADTIERGRKAQAAIAATRGGVPMRLRGR